MLAKHEVSECIARLARGMDRHDVELARSAFHEDSRDDHGVFIGSGHGSIDWMNDFHDSALRSHQHYLATQTIDLDLTGNEAHVETYVMVIGGSKGDWSNTLGGGRYLDRLECRHGRWALTDRVTIVEWWSVAETMERVAATVYPFSQDRSDPSYRRPLRADRGPRDLTRAELKWSPERD